MVSTERLAATFGINNFTVNGPVRIGLDGAEARILVSSDANTLRLFADAAETTHLFDLNDGQFRDIVGFVYGNTGGGPVKVFLREKDGAGFELAEGVFEATD